MRCRGGGTWTEASNGRRLTSGGSGVLVDIAMMLTPRASGSVAWRGKTAAADTSGRMSDIGTLGRNGGAATNEDEGYHRVQREKKTTRQGRGGVDGDKERRRRSRVERSDRRNRHQGRLCKEDGRKRHEDVLKEEAGWCH